MDDNAITCNIDTSKVELVRSAKGCVMLCVDKYLYHYDDRGNKSYRWVCNRRKDKAFQCRARLITAESSDEGDARHIVKKVVGEHTHERCSATEIAKAYERKRLANLGGVPCTLVNKLQKRKQRRLVEIGDSMRNYSNGFSSDEGEENVDNMYDGTNATVYVLPEYECAESTTAVTASSTQKEREQIYLEDGAIYFLKKPNGQQMACLDGQLYCLASTSDNNTTFRWDCVRRGRYCYVSLFTQCLSNGKHRLQQSVEMHTHEAYTAGNLTKVIAKNRLSLAMDEVQSEDTLMAHNPDDEFLSEPDEVATPMEQLSNVTAIKRLTFKPRVNDIDNTYELCVDPMEMLKDAGSTQQNRKKFAFLPSAKGNNVLCVDNFIYHFDSRTNSNGHAYWTCVMRRHKKYKCNGRITTKTTDDGPRILKVSGTHEHPGNVSDIKRRLCKSASLKNNDSLLKDGDLEVTQDQELSDIAHIDRQQCDEPCVTKSKNDDSSSFVHTYVEQNEGNSEYVKEGHSAYTDTQLCTSINDIKVYDEIWCTDDIIEELPIETEYLDTTNEYEEEDFQAISKDDIESVQYTLPMPDESVLNSSNGGDDDGTCAPLLRKRKATDLDDANTCDMDISQVSVLRSAKGDELLCIDGYLYHLRMSQKKLSYWSCIKCNDRTLKCQSRVVTANNSCLKVIKISNPHTHSVCKSEKKRRLDQHSPTPKQSVQQSFCELDTCYDELLESSSCSMSQQYEAFDKEEEYLIAHDGGFRNDEEHFFESTCNMKLYAVSDGPPSLAVRMALKALNIPFELISVDFMSLEHMTEEYAKMNPQKEIPVLDDNGFYLSESIAILQYLCDKYAPDSSLYPKDATTRAIVNHRLCFNMGFYYSTISAHVMAPIFFDYKRTDMSLKKLTNALDVFETYLQRSGTKYAAADHLTIADFALVSATLCLEAIGFDLSPYPLVKKWYGTFKKEYPELWEVAQGGMKEIAEFEKNPPDLSHIKHPFHATRKLN